MSQVEPLTEPKSIKLAELKDLIEKAIREGKEESKLILVVEEWRKLSWACRDEKEVRVIYGDAMTLELEVKASNEWFHRRIAIIPGTVPTVVLTELYDDCNGEEIRHKVVHVFTPEGWKRLDVL